MTRVMRWDNLIKSKQRKKYQSLILNKLNIEKKLRKKNQLEKKGITQVNRVNSSNL